MRLESTLRNSTECHPAIIAELIAAFLQLCSLCQRSSGNGVCFICNTNLPDTFTHVHCCPLRLAFRRLSSALLSSTHYRSLYSLYADPWYMNVHAGDQAA